MSRIHTFYFVFEEIEYEGDFFIGAFVNLKSAIAKIQTRLGNIMYHHLTVKESPDSYAWHAYSKRHQLSLPVIMCVQRDSSRLRNRP